MLCVEILAQPLTGLLCLLRFPAFMSLRNDHFAAFAMHHMAMRMPSPGAGVRSCVWLVVVV
jgi:hypothetical protein